MTTQDFDAAAATFDEDFRIERARSVAEHIARMVALAPTMSSLDFGCGTGLLGFALLPKIGEMSFADTSSGMLQEVRRKIPPEDAHRIHTVLLDPDGAGLTQPFDLIVSLMTLHHIPEAEATVRMLARHLKPGGTLALADLESEDGSFHGLDAEVHKGFDRATVRDWMTDNGLRDVRESTPWIMRREVVNEAREYPLFLITAAARGDGVTT